MTAADQHAEAGGCLGGRDLPPASISVWRKGLAAARLAEVLVCRACDCRKSLGVSGDFVVIVIAGLMASNGLWLVLPTRGTSPGPETVTFLPSEFCQSSRLAPWRTPPVAPSAQRLRSRALTSSAQVSISDWSMSSAVMYGRS